MDHRPNSAGANGSGSSFVHRTIVGLGIAATYAVLIVLLWYAREIFFMAFAGILLAVFLNTIAGSLRRHSPLRHGGSLCLTVIGLLLLLALAGWLMQSQLLSELQQFSGKTNNAWTKATNDLQKSDWGQWLLGHLPQGKTLWNEVVSASRVGRIFSSTLGAIVTVVVILFVGLYGAAQPHWYREGILRLVPPSRRDRARQTLDAVEYNLRWWIVGQLISMTCVGVLVGVTMWLLGVPLPLTLGIIAFLLEFIPNVGPILAGIPAVLLAWGGGGSMLALWTLLAYVVIQLLESYVITPLVYREAVWLPPAVFLLAVVLFGLIGGFLGVLIAAPLTVTLIVIIKMMYVEDALSDHAVAVPGEPS